MYNKKMYNKLVFYVEACESGSMFKDVLPKNLNIFVTTAANADESSYACYFDDARSTYLGDWYSVNWMEDTDREDIGKETLDQQFKITRNETNTSHVMEYGDLSLGKLPVAQFQGLKKTQRFAYSAKSYKTTAPSYEVPMDILYRRLSSANSQDERRKIKAQITDMQSKRQLVERTWSKIVRNIAFSTFQEEKWLKSRPARLTQLRCHNELVHAFSKSCFNFGKNPYAMKFAYILANMCEDNVDPTEAIETFEDMCQDILIKEGIHWKDRLFSIILMFFLYCLSFVYSD